MWQVVGSSPGIPYACRQSWQREELIRKFYVYTWTMDRTLKKLWVLRHFLECKDFYTGRKTERVDV